jgi:RHS repeat-associated protein
MGDHLGSTSLAVNASTGAVIETRYKAWGEVRYTTPNVTLPTRNTFTGQYSYVSDDATDLGSSGFGLMFYQSRWYDPSLGRMAQADTIVPGGVQGLDRYAYVNNSPLNYVDPSGHFGQCHDGQSGYQCRMTQQRAAQVNFRGQQAQARAQARANNISCLRNSACDSSGIVVNTGGSNGGVVVQGGGGSATSLNFTGYSDWEIEALQYLYDNGGPDAQHGVEYMLAHGIHIVLLSDQSLLSLLNRGGGFDDNHVYIVADQSTLLQNFWALSNIIHEALHIEQGAALSHSVEGERLAWQTGLRVYKIFSPQEFVGDSVYQKILEDTTPQDFADDLWDPFYKYTMLAFYTWYPSPLYTLFEGCGNGGYCPPLAGK